MTVAPRLPAGVTQARADRFVEIVLPDGDEPPTLNAGYRLTDLGNSERLVARHGNDLRYVASEGSWFVWDGLRWARDVTDAVVQHAAETVRAMYTDAAAQRSTDHRKELARHATRSESVSRIRAMIELARSSPEVATLRQDLDRDPFRLTVANGTIDLRTASLEPAARDDLITKLAPVEYDAGATCPRWLAFLDRVLAGKWELVAFLQRAVGYSLTGDTREQCLFLLHGTGANGKSTFLEVLRELLGEYATQADFATFLEKRTDGPRNDVARLVGARLVTSSEAGEGRRLNESLIKSLTGGDTIAARFLFREAFEFPPTFKLWLAANHKPVIRGVGEAIWRRIRLVPFTVTIPEAERDDRLRSSLSEELPGILRWAVEGCQMWLESGLRMPDEVRDATDGYRQESDVLGDFLDECCERDASAAVEATALYQRYKSWAAQSGEHTMSQKEFGTALEERGFAKLNTNHHSRTRRVGLRLLAGQDTGGSGTVGDSSPLYVGHSLFSRGGCV